MEKDLLDKARTGDENAFSQLLDLNLKKVTNSLRQNYKSLSNQDFEDAVQIATIKAWNKIQSFRGESTFSTWLYIIVKNEILNIANSTNHVRKYEVSTENVNPEYERLEDYDRVPTSYMLDEAVLDTAQTMIEKQDEMTIFREMLDKVLGKLKPDHSKVIHLVFNEGKSYKEVSDELGVPIGTVMSRLYFARKNAQKLINQYAQRNNIQLACLR